MTINKMLFKAARCFSVISGRYSVTLYNSAVRAQELEKVAEDVKYLKELFAASPEFKVLTTDPTIKRQLLGDVLEEFFTQAGFAATTKRTLALMMANQRLGALQKVVSEFSELLRSKEQKEEVKVVAANELSPAEKKEVEGALREFDRSKTYSLSFDVDKAIIGGLQLYFPTAFMDLSLKSRLDKIKDELGNLAA